MLKLSWDLRSVAGWYGMVMEKSGIWIVRATFLGVSEAC